MGILNFLEVDLNYFLISFVILRKKIITMKKLKFLLTVIAMLVGMISVL